VATTPLDSGVPRGLSEASTPAPSHVLVTNGEQPCPGGLGAIITSVQECSNAAVALGLSDVTAVVQSSNLESHPRGCWLHVVPGHGSALYLNPSTTSSSPCTDPSTHSTSEQCVCRQTPCQDHVAQWYDGAVRWWHDDRARYFHCAWYASDTGGRCRDYGDSNPNFGMTANVACCACGGGERATSAPTPSPTPSPTSAPTPRP
jgi:hypothetical protein